MRSHRGGASCPPCLILRILQAHIGFFNISTNKYPSLLLLGASQLCFHLALTNTHFLQTYTASLSMPSLFLTLPHTWRKASFPIFEGYCIMPALCTWVPLRTSLSRDLWEHTSNPFHVYQIHFIIENFMSEVLSDDAIWSYFANKWDRTALFGPVFEPRVPSKDKDVSLWCVM